MVSPDVLRVIVRSPVKITSLWAVYFSSVQAPRAMGATAWTTGPSAAAAGAAGVGDEETAVAGFDCGVFPEAGPAAESEAEDF